MKRMNVYLVDDNATSLHMIAQFLGTHPHFQVVGESRSGAEALSAIPATLPDIVLMDISMPGMNGIEATRRIKAMLPDLPVVMLTINDIPEYREAAASAGAAAFVSKADCFDTLIDVLEQFAQEETREHTETARTGTDTNGKEIVR
jgi:DNA-binding NarL/FixJ family response regulator